MTLGLRLGRRLIAAVAVQNERVTFHDCRFVTSRRDALERAMRAYFVKILDQLSPAQVCYYAPTTAHTATEQLTVLLTELATARCIPVVRTDRANLLQACGLPLGAKRSAVRDQMRDLWPALADGRPDRQLVGAEALLSALVADLDF